MAQDGDWIERVFAPRGSGARALRGAVLFTVAGLGLIIVGALAWLWVPSLIVGFVLLMVAHFRGVFAGESLGPHSIPPVYVSVEDTQDSERARKD